MKTEPFIHTFKTSKEFYMYDVNMDQILLIPKWFYDDLSVDKNLTEASSRSKRYSEHLKEYGYLKGDRVEEVKHPFTDYLPFLLWLL